MRIASTAHSMAPRPPNAPADPHPLWPRLIAMLGANIVTVYFAPRLPLDWKFATRTFIRRSHSSVIVKVLCSLSITRPLDSAGSRWTMFSGRSLIQ